MNEVAMWILGIGVPVIVTVIGSLLAKKDSAQEREINDLRGAHEKQITELWNMHNIDAQALQDLRIQIASNHYVKQELDVRFDKLEAAFTAGFRDLGDRFDRLAEKLTTNGRV
jgi:hypothetical protein